MGFKRTQTYYNLHFDDPQLDGLVVKLRRGSIRERMEFEALEDWKARIDGLASFLVEWNITDDDDQPLPTTAESLWSLEEPTLVAILRAYTEAVYPAAPLEDPSTAGDAESPTVDLELEASMPMTSLAS
jgi:hypothetical protein